MGTLVSHSQHRTVGPGELKIEADTNIKYLNSFSRSFIERSPGKVCVELFDSVKLDGIIEAQVYIKDEEEKGKWIIGEPPLEKLSLNIRPGENIKCFDLELPETEASTRLLNIKINFKGSSHSVNLFKEITFLKKEIYPLI